MTVIPIVTASTPAVPPFPCLGMCCLKHGDCTHYHAVESMQADDARLISTCERGGVYPMYEAVGG